MKCAARLASRNRRAREGTRRPPVPFGGVAERRLFRQAPAFDCRKSENELSSSHEQSCASACPRTAGASLDASAAAAKGREKFLSAKIPRNPLKRLDSDERIQGNPSFSNPQKRGLRGQTASAKKTQTDRPAQGRALCRLLPAELVQDLLRRARAFGRAALHVALVVDRAVLAGEEDVALPHFLVAGE